LLLQLVFPLASIISMHPAITVLNQILSILLYLDRTGIEPILLHYEECSSHYTTDSFAIHCFDLLYLRHKYIGVIPCYHVIRSLNIFMKLGNVLLLEIGYGRTRLPVPTEICAKNFRHVHQFSLKSG
jgi:hypothetical protein